LEELENLPTGYGLCFSDWLKRLDIAHIRAEKDGDPRHHFLDILIKATRAPAIDNPNSDERPQNVIPLSIYHQELQYYTDGNYRDVISELNDESFYLHNHRGSTI
jgi:hypothetical protein